MTVGFIPAARASAMPVAAATKDASAVTGKDAGAPETAHFAAVLQHKAGAQTQDRPANRRLDTRAQSRKDDSNDNGEGRGTTAVVDASSRMVSSAIAPVAAEASSAALGEVGLQATAALTNTATDAGGALLNASASGVDPAQGHAGAEASGAEAQDGATAGTKDRPAVIGQSGVDGTTSGNAASGLSLVAAPDAGAAIPELLTVVAGMTAAAAPVLGDAISAADLTATPAEGSAKQQGSTLNGGGGKAFGTARHPELLGTTASVPGKAGLAKTDFGAGSQAGLAGENGRGQHDGKGETRSVGKGSADASNSGIRGGTASDQAGTGAASPAAVAASPVLSVVAASLPIVPVPTQAPVSPAVQDATGSRRGEAGPPDLASGAASAAANGVAVETVPLTSVGAARLLKTVAGSELRVGTQSADLGAVTIRTVLGREQMQTHILFENERMGSALSAHLTTLGGSLEDRLGQSLGVRASVTLSASADAGTGQSGREAARDGLAGHGNGTAGGREGSGRRGAEAVPGGFGGVCGVAASVSRPMAYGGMAGMGGRLDIRV